jgi:hypothetical protein
MMLHVGEVMAFVACSRGGIECLLVDAFLVESNSYDLIGIG